jgi:membrane protease YdiL (CAAX protease family)
MTPSSTGSFNVALLTAFAFIGLLIVVVLIARFKRIPLPFAAPPFLVIVGWVALFAVAALAQELLGGYLGGEPAAKWDSLTPARLIRAVTIVLLAPLAEEVAFRGTMYGSLVKKGLHPALVILLPALAFTAVHFQYSGPGLVFILVDGIIFGLARHRTGSLFVPVLLHTLGNAYAVAERVPW